MGRFNNYGNGRGRRNNQFEDEHCATEKPKVEIIPSTPRGAKLREELLTKIVPWEKITVSFDDFPYYVEEDTKSRLVECVTPILKRNKKRKFCARLDSSSRGTLLRSIPGSELYRERLVSALAREMQVPLLKLDEDHGCDHDNKDYEDDDLYWDEAYEQKPKFKKGDRVQYIERSYSFEEANNRTLTNGQRGEVYEVNGYTVGVAFNICGLRKRKADKDEKNTEILRKALLVWLNVKDVILVDDSQARIHDCHIAMEVLCQVLEPQQPVIVYFADSFLWPQQTDYRMYVSLRCIFSQLPEGVAMICPKNYSQDESQQEAAKTPTYESRYGNGKHKLFSNAICINSPKDKDLKTVISEANLQTMHKVLKDHDLSCLNMEHLDIDNMILERKKVEKIVGWAVSHYLTSCPLPCVNEEKLHIPYESIKLAISRLMEEEDPQRKWIASAVVRSEDIGVKFDDVGVLENVKNVLYKTVILPMRRPELFSHGNTLRFCKGILLFGPPGTGKPLTAKALTAEAGANFINITAATFTSMNFEALFSCASKSAPVIIYLDEVDSFPGACGPDIYNTNQLTKFMTAWDDWNSKESHRVLLIAATNRPFDLDEAVICHFPRRIYIGLPDGEIRSKMLKIFLDKENLESGFSFDQLAEATEGYSMMDL